MFLRPNDELILHVRIRFVWIFDIHFPRHTPVFWARMTEPRGKPHAAPWPLFAFCALELGLQLPGGQTVVVLAGIAVRVTRDTGCSFNTSKDLLFSGHDVSKGTDMWRSNSGASTILSNTQIYLDWEDLDGRSNSAASTIFFSIPEFIKKNPPPVFRSTLPNHLCLNVWMLDNSDLRSPVCALLFMQWVNTLINADYINRPLARVQAPKDSSDRVCDTYYLEEHTFKMRCPVL